MVTETLLKQRAKTLAMAMSERLRWVYALPLEGSFAAVCEILDAEAIPKVEQAADARVVRYASDEQQMSFVVFEHEALGVVLLEADGEAVVPIMRRLLDQTGFIPQSRLWGAALDVEDLTNARKAVLTLAHMAVVWDEDWTDLFLLHLASPDAVVRHDATVALTMAALVAREVTPALELFREARSREKFPKLAESMEEAMTFLEASAGAPVDLAAVAKKPAPP